MMEAFNIPVFSAQGYEADDVIGTLSVQAAAQGIDTYIVTLDSDLVQLIQPNVTIYMMRPYQRDHVIYNETTAQRALRLRPAAHGRLQGAARRHAPTTSPASPASATAPRRSC